MAKLEQQGIVPLPRLEKTYGYEKHVVHPIRIGAPEICYPLSELGEVSVTPVPSRYAKDSKLWVDLSSRLIEDCYF